MFGTLKGLGVDLRQERDTKQRRTKLKGDLNSLTWEGFFEDKYKGRYEAWEARFQAYEEYLILQLC